MANWIDEVEILLIDCGNPFLVVLFSLTFLLSKEVVLVAICHHDAFKVVGHLYLKLRIVGV